MTTSRKVDERNLRARLRVHLHLTPYSNTFDRGNLQEKGGGEEGQEASPLDEAYKKVEARFQFRGDSQSEKHRSIPIINLEMKIS